MTEQESSQQSTILIELQEYKNVEGTIPISITPSNIAKQSAVALNKALSTVKHMAYRVVTSVQQIPITERPHEIEVTFGLKLTTDANALIVNAGTEAQFTVKMKWVRQEQEVDEAANKDKDSQISTRVTESK